LFWQVFGFDFDDFWKNPDDRLFNHYLNEFQKPIEDLLKDTDYPELQAKFAQNAYAFALAKASTFFEKSKKLSKADTKALFLKMERHNDTEKVQFALSIQAAEEWQAYLQDADTFPNLEYRAVMDENTRESHAQLNGIIKPIKDDFWSRYFPPIDYRCRCTLRQHGKNAKITEKLPENLPKIPKGLDHNPGTTGEAFNTRHPYFENINSKNAFVSGFIDDQNAQYLQIHPRLKPDNKTPEDVMQFIKNKDKGHLYIFNDKGEQVARYKGEENYTNPPEEQLFRLKNATVIHNHPNSWSFSLPDILAATRYNAKKMIVVSPKYTYIVERNGDKWGVDLHKNEDDKALLEEIRSLSEQATHKDITQGLIYASEKEQEISHKTWTWFFKEKNINYERRKID